MAVYCITQARMSSSRLPGKVLLKIKQIPLLGYHLARVQQSKLINQHWLAISEDIADDPLAAYLTQQRSAFYRGSEHDVLERFYQTAINAGAKTDDLVIRLTGDCPLVCPELLDRVISEHIRYNSQGYSHLSLAEFPRGFDTEIFSMALLTAAQNKATQPAEREHVTMYMYQQHRYPIHAVKGGATDWSRFRLCVDQAEDFALIEQLATQLDELVTVDAATLCSYLQQHPQLAKINEQVQQKTAH